MMTRMNGRALHNGFLADEPSPETTGAAFAPMHDELRVRGNWRTGPSNGGVPLAMVVLIGLPLGLMAWSRLRLRMEQSRA
ncbi:hypothetical protein [Azospirillum sp. ST 5-10]|uniref:hypothetical protein n=2 Tax=unclassified Azospirillum TaxID=2630922 RepID=UPI003F4A3369